MTKKFETTARAFNLVFLLLSVILFSTCSKDDATDTPDVLVETITVQGSDITDGGTSQMAVIISPANASNQKVTWAVSDQAIATINEDGLVTAVNDGTVTVTAVAQDASGVSGQRIITISGSDDDPDDPDDAIVVSTEEALLSAISEAGAGDVILVKGGTYRFSSTIELENNGEENNRIELRKDASDDERPTFDFSDMSESSSNRGVELSGDHWYVYGIDIYQAGDNGMFISGSDNLIEFCTFSENADSGLQIANGGANNTILNCDSYFNADTSLENADGFAAKLDVGTGNKFISCRAWNNLDDGWDGYLRGAEDISTTYENCWAIRNGILKNGTVGQGDGNGFKTGGSDDKQLKHHAMLTNCLAVANVADGFDHNSNRGDIIIYHASAYNNGTNFNFSSSNIAASLTIKNSVSLDGDSSDKLNATTTDITNNGWQNGITTNSNDFVTLDVELLLADRQADGSLPVVSFMKLVNGSDLIDAGVDVGLRFSRTTPDLGAFELE